MHIEWRAMMILMSPVPRITFPNWFESSLNPAGTNVFLENWTVFCLLFFFPFFSDLQVSVQVSGALGWFLCESTCQFVFILMWRVENDKQNPLKMSLVLRKSSFANGSSQNSSWNLFKSQLWWTVDKISTCYEGNKCYSKMNKLTIKKIKMLQILWSVDSWKKNMLRRMILQ